MEKDCPEAVAASNLDAELPANEQEPEYIEMEAKSESSTMKVTNNIDSIAEKSVANTQNPTRNANTENDSELAHGTAKSPSIDDSSKLDLPDAEINVHAANTEVGSTIVSPTIMKPELNKGLDINPQLPEVTSCECIDDSSKLDLPDAQINVDAANFGAGSTIVISTVMKPDLDKGQGINPQSPEATSCECTASSCKADVSTLPTPMECESLPNAIKPSNGLSLLSGYGSDVDSDVADVAEVEDSDNDDVVEVPVNSNKIRRQVVTVSTSSESNKSSDSDSSSEAEYLTVLRQKIEKRINTEDCDEEDDDDLEDGAKPRRQPPKVRGEMLLDDLPPIEQLEITVPEDECIELGKIQSIVDQLVLVSVLPNSMLFDLDTVLFLDKGRKVLGQVFDVIGQVADPLYCVRFNSNQQIKDRNINIGDIVYCAPQTEHTQFVILSKLMQLRGSDASWEHDVEPPPRFIDYSDDEAEREARLDLRKKRQRERINSTDSTDTVSTTATTTTATSSAPQQRGRRAQRQSQSYANTSGSQQSEQSQARSQSRDSEYNIHPSYNPGSWHSNYYHNYHPPPANFNMMPGMGFPMPNHGYGYMPPPLPPAPHPYGMPMVMPPHMYPPQPMGYGPPPQQQPPPN